MRQPILHRYSLGLLILYAATWIVTSTLVGGRDEFTVLVVALIPVGLVLLTVGSVAIRHRITLDDRDLPTVHIVIPARNEESVIADTISAVLDSEYPADRLRVTVVDDGSTDRTRQILESLAAGDGRLNCILQDVSTGKRRAVLRGLETTDEEFVLMIDSDTIVKPDAIRILARSFDKETSAVCGEVRIRNRKASLATRIQEFDYFISFHFFKAFESHFGLVTCAPGCFSMLRRSSLEAVIADWDDQIVLGRRCSYGEDRFLTTLMLPNGRIEYQPAAHAETVVPDTMGGLVRQRLRWGRSWFTNMLLASRFMFRQHPVAAGIFYVVFITTLLMPLWLVQAALYLSEFAVLQGTILLGLAAVQGSFAVARGRVGAALRAPIYFAGYLLLLVWLIPWSIVTITDNAWGSRGK